MIQYPILKTSFNHKSFCLTSVATENKTSTTKICLCVKFHKFWKPWMEKLKVGKVI